MCNPTWIKICVVKIFKKWLQKNAVILVQQIKKIKLTKQLFDLIY